ncbi:MAG: hypothetical protein ACE5IM_04565 [Nitrospinota bacterium]
MRIPLGASLLVLLVLGPAVPRAGADVTLRQRITLRFPQDATETPRRVVFYAKGDRVRFEGDAWRKKPTIFQFDKGLVLRLDPRKKTYTKVALKDLENVFKDTVRIVRGVDEMVGGKRTGGGNSPLRLKPTEIREPVNGFGARVYLLRGTRPDKPRVKIWITRDSDAGREVYPLQRKIANISANLLLSLDPRLYDELERVGGTAVRILVLGKVGAFGPIRTDMVVESIDRRPLDDALFEVPPGYRGDAGLKERNTHPNGRRPSAMERRLKALLKLFQ